MPGTTSTAAATKAASTANAATAAVKETEELAKQRAVAAAATQAKEATEPANAQRNRYWTRGLAGMSAASALTAGGLVLGAFVGSSSSMGVGKAATLFIANANIAFAAIGMGVVALVFGLVAAAVAWSNNKDQKAFKDAQIKKLQQEKSAGKENGKEVVKQAEKTVATTAAKTKETTKPAVKAKEDKHKQRTSIKRESNNSSSEDSLSLSEDSRRGDSRSRSGSSYYSGSEGSDTSSRGNNGYGPRPYNTAPTGRGGYQHPQFGGGFGGRPGGFGPRLGGQPQPYGNFGPQGGFAPFQRGNFGGRPPVAPNPYGQRTF